ncbi:amino acid adenylation domain-containing protein [Longispora sp. NPDC051575]|uniref:non-ribosomal peptide synthetase n=1 Tax=Longispora sp. NPDC051575 TaxID=3154943 RepID=UPI0034168C13
MTTPTPAQHGLWITERAGYGGAAHHLALTVRFTGPLDTDALLAACRDVAAAHPALGLALRDRDGEPVLVPALVAPGVALLAGADPGAVLAAETARPFDLETGPLARFTLVVGADDHVLVVVVHHLVFDGQSKDILVTDLAAAYARRGGGPSAGVGGATTAPGSTARSAPGLPAGSGPAAGHGDAAVPSASEVGAHRDPDDVVGADPLPAAREFWAGRWREPAAVALPGHRTAAARPAGPRRGAALDLPISPELDRALAEAARALGVTRFELLLGAVRALLALYGNPEPTVAVDLSTRTPDDQHRIGLYVNELPVTGPADPAAPFADTVTATRAALRALYPHRAVPLARAVGRLAPRSAMADVSVSYRAAGPDPAFPHVGATVDRMVFCGAARNPLHLQILDHRPGLAVSLRHDPDVLDGPAAARIGADLLALLTAAASAPSTPVADLGADLGRPGTVDWHGPTVEVPYGTALDAFDKQLAATPDAPAASCGDVRVSYAELDAASRRLARRLRAAGATAGTLVAIRLPRSVDLLVGVLAVWRAGAAYVPVDPGYPAERQALILADSGAPVLLTTGALAERPGEGTQVVLVEQVPPAVEGDKDAASRSVDHAPDPGDPAYVLYTSGSTGRPKGVVIEHRALANLLAAIRATVRGDAWLAWTSLSFDISILELLGPLVGGDRVVLVPESDARDGAAVARLIGRENVAVAQATPSGWRLLLDSGLRGGDLTALCGGEALSTALAGELAPRVGRLLNVYGPTETTVWSTLAEVDDPGDVHIGRPLANTTVHLLDDERRPVPAGTPGELWIGGTGLARGYHRRPDLTADRFPTVAGERLYRTGDLARRRPDGTLDFLGRLDDQIKLRGHRIEPGEVEARLLGCPGVTGAAVAVRGDTLVGYTLGGVPAEDLRARLAAALPPAMVPGVFVALDRLPLTPNGKLDRAALPAPAHAPVAAAPGGSALADAVRDIWQEVLRVDGIGPDEDLFDLGGHSLSITQISARIRKRLGADVALDVFYDTPTIAGVVAAIERKDHR